MLIQLILIILAAIVSLIVGTFIMIGIFHKKVLQGQALIRTGFGGSHIVYDSGIFVIPALHKLEKIDISIKKVEVNLSKSKPLLFKNDMAANYKAFFFVRVNKDKASIIEVAQTIGCTKTYDSYELNEIFQPIFASAVKKTAREFEIDSIYDHLDDFENRIYEYVGTDLNGFTLDQMATDSLEICPSSN